MNIKEMRGVALKKALGAKSAAFRYHNRNTRGGNFAVEIRGLLGKDYEISGDYNQEGDIRGLRIGHLFQHGCRIEARDFEHLVSIILSVATPSTVKLGEV